MKYIYAYRSAYSTGGYIEIEILDEQEVFDRLYAKVGLTNRFDSVDELVKFIHEWQIFDLEGGETITVATLSGEILLQAM